MYLKSRPRSATRKYAKLLLTLLGVFLILAYASHEAVLNGILHTLIRKDDIRPAEAIIPLSGSYKGECMETAIDLFKKGYGKNIIFSGGERLYRNTTMAEAYLRQTEEAGIPTENLLWSQEKPTKEKPVASIIFSLLEENNMKSFILLAPPLSSARLGKIYGKLAEKQGYAMHVYPCSDPAVKYENWWKDRYTAKMVYFELSRALF